MLKFTDVMWHCAVFVVFVGLVWSQTTTTTSPVTATTPSDLQECRALNTSCEKCVSLAKCMWCSSKPEKCFPYPAGQVIPHKDVCPLSDARWGVCWVNYKVLLICMGVLAILLLVSCTCCIYCCCCRSKGKNSKKYAQEEAKLENEKTQRKARHDERRAERKEKLDEIRRKYGLVKEDNPYERFDA